MTRTLMAVVGYAVWTMALTMLIAAVRSGITFKGGKAPNDFSPTGEDLGGFSQRLARAHANCYENLPVAAAILLVAVASGQGNVSDPHALWILYARVAQSLVHLTSTSIPAVFIRFGFFLVQVVLLMMIVVGLF